MCNFQQLLIIAGSMLCAVGANADANSSRAALPDTPFRMYSSADGLSQSAASSLGQDQAGRLLVTTLRGLNLFDGREFSAITTNDGLEINWLTAVHADNYGHIWLGDKRGGITCIENDRVSKTLLPEALAGAQIISIVSDSDSALFANSQGGIVHIDSNDFAQRVVQEPSPDDLLKEMELSQGTLWLVRKSGLWRKDLANDEPAVLILEDIALSHLARDGTHWLVDKNGKFGYRDEQSKFVVLSDLGVSAGLNGIDETSTGSLWVLSESTLQHVVATTDGVAEVFDVATPYESVRVLVDREDTVWLASQTGLARYFGRRFSHFSLSQERLHSPVWSIDGTDDGDTFVVTDTEMWLFDANGGLENLTQTYSLPVQSYGEVEVTPKALFLADPRAGVVRLDRDSKEIAAVPGTINYSVYDILVDDIGDMWMGTNKHGLVHGDGLSGEWQEFKVSEETTVYAVNQSSDGSIWFIVDYFGAIQLVRQADGSFTRIDYTEASGLPSISYNDLVEVEKGKLLISGSEGALFVLEEGIATRIGEDLWFRDQSIYQIVPQTDGSILLGLEAGLYRVTADYKSGRLYDANQGFLGTEVNSNTRFVSKPGELWLGTMAGATRIDTGLPWQELQELPVQVFDPINLSADKPIREGGEVPWSERDIGFRFTAVSLSQPTGITFVYQLAGHDDDWSRSSTTKSVSYSALAPGEYQLRVKARLPGGQWSEPAASSRFTVRAPFWLEPWFLLLMLAMLAGATVVFVRLRTRRVMIANEVLKREVAARTRSIADVEARFRIAFQHTPVGMGLVRANGDVIEANPALLSLLRGERASADSPLALLPLAADEENLEKLASGIANTDGVQDLLVDCVDPHGKTLKANISITPAIDSAATAPYSVIHLNDVTTNFKLTERLEEQANHDDLTGLINRRAFDAILEQIYENSDNSLEEQLSYLLYADLDRFKVVNDTAGHAAGDALLIHVAELMRQHTRDSDVVARTGGDEFAFILRSCRKSAVERIAEALRMSIDEFRFNWDKDCFQIGISIGAIPIDPVLGSISDIQQMADGACYQAKEGGRNRVVIVDTREEKLLETRGEGRWAQRLRDAMDTGKFTLYGQRMFSVTPELTGEPEQVEVLLRLRDVEQKRLIPPGAFLPAAERYGLAIELDKWVVKNLLKTLYVHQSFGGAYCQYWVNLSGSSVGDERFVEFLLDAVGKSPLAPGSLNFEVTETSVIRNLTLAEQMIVRLREMGCQVALDDFGSGLSSFAYLKRLPFDRLKIDGIFVRDIVTDSADRLFVKSIIDIAHSLGMKTTAEFVENDEILAAVKTLNVDFAQGFGLHRPEVLAPDFPGNKLLGMNANAKAVERHLPPRGRPVYRE